MSDKKVRFRQSISGFNKDDVNCYISDLTAKHLKETQEDKKTIAELEAKIKRLEDEIEECLQKHEKEKADAENERITALAAEKEELAVENERLRSENAQLSRMIDSYKKAQAETAALWEKSSKYDEVSSQIGSLIVSANAEASGIIARAKLKACVVSDRMIEETKDRLTEMGNKYVNEISSKTAELTDRLKKLADKAEEFKKETDSALENDCVLIRDTLDAIRKNDNYTEDNENE